MIEYELSWKSTPEERYDSDQIAQAELLAAQYGHVIGTEGGMSRDQVCDNHLLIRVDNEEQAKLLNQMLAIQLTRSVSARPVPTVTRPVTKISEHMLVLETKRERFKRFLVRVFVCGIRGHDMMTKFSGTRVCRRNCR